MADWIAVADAVPDGATCSILVTNGGYCEMGCFTKRRKFEAWDDEAGCWYKITPTHWLDIPDSPE